MYSITGYFFDGSKLRGFHTRPQMSVVLSRPFATKTSGAFQPSLTRAEMSPLSISAINVPSARFSSDTLAMSTRE